MPEPILVAIAAALAGKGASSLYDLVKKKFADRKRAEAALEAADGAAPHSDEVAALSEFLAEAERDDAEFATALRSRWAQISGGRAADHGSVVNEVSGNVHGAVIQAQHIEGGISFGDTSYP